MKLALPVALLALGSLLVSDAKKPLPLVMWHGMGDSCCSPMGMGSMKKMFELRIPGIYIKSLMIGSSMFEDTKNSYLMNINDQVARACKQIAEDPELNDGYNAIGISQVRQLSWVLTSCFVML